MNKSKSIYDQLLESGELKVKSCDDCEVTCRGALLYELDGDTYCQRCLIDMEWETGTELTLLERNS